RAPDLQGGHDTAGNELPLKVIGAPARRALQHCRLGGVGPSRRGVAVLAIDDEDRLAIAPHLRPWGRNGLATRHGESISSTSLPFSLARARNPSSSPLTSLREPSMQEREP